MGRTRSAMPAALILTVALVAAASAQAPEAKPAAEPAAEPTAAELEGRLLEKAAPPRVRAGQSILTDELIDLFLSYADARAREKLVPKAVTPEFWQWLRGKKAIHKALLVDLDPDYNPGVVQCLARLRQDFPDDIDEYIDLALAFAMVHGRLGARPVSAGWCRVVGRQDIPAMVDSFRYYMNRRADMVYPLTKLPWPLLVYVADNDLPISERAWVLSRYERPQPAEFGKIYYDAPYDEAGAQSGKPKIAEVPYTLVNIARHGGVCVDQAYYGSRVLKSLGVPALLDAGQGARGEHSWLAWIVPEKGRWAMAFSGRWDFDKYYTGQVYCPLLRKQMPDREVELVSAAVGHSLDRYLDALIACHVYEMLDQEGRNRAVGLVREAIGHRNPYCGRAWRHLAAAIAQGVIPRRQGEQLYAGMLKPFAAYPDLTFEVLGSILAPRLKASPGEAADSEVTANLALLDKAFALYDKAERPDLAVQLRLLQGRYLEAVGRTDRALKLYVAESQRYVDAHYGFVDLFDRAVELLRGDDKQAMRLKYIDYMATHVTKFVSEFHRQSGMATASYLHVVGVYVAELKAAGKDADAARWEAELPRKRP